jgi:hypothetical protein
MAGKGSKTRPLSIKYEEYADNFDNIFRKDKPKPEEVKPVVVREVKK